MEKVLVNVELVVRYCLRDEEGDLLAGPDVTVTRPGALALVDKKKPDLSGLLHSEKKCRLKRWWLDQIRRNITYPAPEALAQLNEALDVYRRSVATEPAHVVFNDMEGLQDVLDEIRLDAQRK